MGEQEVQLKENISSKEDSAETQDANIPHWYFKSLIGRIRGKGKEGKEEKKKKKTENQKRTSTSKEKKTTPKQQNNEKEHTNKQKEKIDKKHPTNQSVTPVMSKIEGRVLICVLDHYNMSCNVRIKSRIVSSALSDLALHYLQITRAHRFQKVILNQGVIW